MLAAAVPAVLGGALLTSPATAQEPRLQVVTGVATSPRAGWLVAEADGGASLSVVADGTRIDSDATALLAGGSELSVVMDAAADDQERQAGTAGAANLVMQLPPTVRTSVVVDSSRPAVAAEPGSALTAVTALTGIAPSRGRATADAIGLALRQFAAAPARGRTVVLFTAAPDAGGEAAPRLADRLTEKGAVLAVVTPDGTPTDYWSTVAKATGGLVLSPGGRSAIAVSDRVAKALGTRYRVSFTAPTALPSEVTLRLRRRGAQASVVVPLLSPPRASSPTAGTQTPVASRPNSTAASRPASAGSPDTSDERSSAVIVVILLAVAVAIVLVALWALRKRIEGQWTEAVAVEPRRPFTPVVFQESSEVALSRAALANLDRFGVSDAARRPSDSAVDVVPAAVPEPKAGVNGHATVPATPAAADGDVKESVTLVPPLSSSETNGSPPNKRAASGSPAAAAPTVPGGKRLQRRDATADETPGEDTSGSKTVAAKSVSAPVPVPTAGPRAAVPEPSTPLPPVAAPAVPAPEPVAATPPASRAGSVTAAYDRARAVAAAAQSAARAAAATSAQTSHVPALPERPGAPDVVELPDAAQQSEHSEASAG